MQQRLQKKRRWQIAPALVQQEQQQEWQWSQRRQWQEQWQGQQSQWLRQERQRRHRRQRRPHRPQSQAWVLRWRWLAAVRLELRQQVAAAVSCRQPQQHPGTGLLPLPQHATGAAHLPAQKPLASCRH